jgi:hypothetical protein
MAEAEAAAKKEFEKKQDCAVRCALYAVRCALAELGGPAVVDGCSSNLQ